jgi:SAM-dependent methyltransferase
MARSDPAAPVAPSSTELRDIYERRFAALESRRTEVWKVLCGRFFERWVKPTDAVMDLGAGYCEFINCVRAGKKFALDLNPATMERAAGGVTVLAQSASETWRLADASVDVVFTSNFLEHLATKQDLVHCLEETARVLRPGGRFIAMGPNIRFAYDVYWDFFDHYLALSDRSMVEALELHGLQPQVVIPQFLPYTMKGRTPTHPLLVRAYLALPPAWKILGKQFVIVAVK